MRLSTLGMAEGPLKSSVRTLLRSMFTIGAHAWHVSLFCLFVGGKGLWAYGL